MFKICFSLADKSIEDPCWPFSHCVQMVIFLFFIASELFIWIPVWSLRCDLSISFLYRVHHFSVVVNISARHILEEKQRKSTLILNCLCVKCILVLHEIWLFYLDVVVFIKKVFYICRRTGDGRKKLFWEPVKINKHK